ncbi:histidine kinase dimerization/phosphoacceptor domain -containing protein [Azospirillum sp. SYSU D00513]|uniref:histidine kinase dimerization/phosphoacceptor domain -containing protein n=1 Tax=Azospirillum sp. SYSU D00513 TaxID=2812561 RepID=UPI001A957FC6|nr:histidine kinase dimerization/phosphoacceptor domain -containing protein [Azospirillum sp. SYSU D00513]
MRAIFIDDDPDSRTLARRAVAREFPSMEAVEVADLDGLRVALDGGPVDLVVTDYRLQFSTGLDVFRMVRERVPDCVVVMFTGTGTEEVAVEAMKAGLDDYVVKSRNHLPRLVASVRNAMERAEDRRALRDARASHQAGQEERALLLEELYHRLHNNLQVVASFVTFAARRFRDPEVREAFTDIVERIHSLTLLQERMYRTRDLRRIDVLGYLEELIPQLAADYGNSVKVEMELAPLRLPIDRASPLALLVNELLLDAIKRAAREGRAVRVTLAVMEGRAEMAIMLSGEAAPQLVPEGSLAHHIASRLASQARAELSFPERAGGSACTLSFPVPAPVPAQETAGGTAAGA